jgi:hypothetical protein
MISVSALTAAAQPKLPYEQTDWCTPETEIDRLVLAGLAAEDIAPAVPCSDEVFIRRVYLAVTGRIPRAVAVEQFLADADPNRRARVIDDLLASDEAADYLTLKWCDLLRVKAEFPINLWPNAVQCYHRWIRDAVGQNMPYDQFARHLLTSSGSNFRVPPVNFYRALQGSEPPSLAAAVALTFMGTRLEAWPQDQRDQMAAFFSRIAYKGTAEWKEEIVYLNPACNDPLDAVLPDGTRVHIEAGEDPRQAFADWLISDDNPWFARSIANRVWSWLMGRGIVHEPDDIRDDNPPVNPELLALLEREMAGSGYDLRHLYRLILNSRTWQQSSIPASDDPTAEKLFAFYLPRRLDAEVLIDTLCWLGGRGESYSSPIPEPFTYIPEYHPTVELADGSITSSFLEMFGRPSRDTGLEAERSNEPTEGQRLYLLNSMDVAKRLSKSPLLREAAAKASEGPGGAIRWVYLSLLSREPTEAEFAALTAYAAEAGLKPQDLLVDVMWALINSKEFLYLH